YQANVIDLDSLIAAFQNGELIDSERDVEEVKAAINDIGKAMDEGKSSMGDFAASAMDSVASLLPLRTPCITWSEDRKFYYPTPSQALSATSQA
ncbi:MAG: hypothetical protein ACKOWH_04735, partial [Rhodoluna sp.]